MTPLFTKENSQVVDMFIIIRSNIPQCLWLRRVSEIQKSR